MKSVAELDKHLKDAEILITTPFHPAYMTKERVQKAAKLKLIMTAGVGSDHIDLQTAADKGMTVVEVTGVPPHFWPDITTSISRHVLVYALLYCRPPCTPASLGLMSMS